MCVGGARIHFFLAAFPAPPSRALLGRTSKVTHLLQKEAPDSRNQNFATGMLSSPTRTSGSYRQSATTDGARDRGEDGPELCLRYGCRAHGT